MSTLNEAWEKYNSTILATKKSRNKAVDQCRWRVHIKDIIGNKHIDDITINDYLNLRLSLEIKKLSPQTVRHCLSLVRRVLNRAVDFNLINKSIPSFIHVFPKFDNKRNRFLNHNEVKYLLQILKDTDWYDIVLFALNTGLRKGEILNLNKYHCDFSSNIIHVVDTKSSKNRIIPLNMVTLDILKRRHKYDGFFFKFKSMRIWNKAIKQCGFNKNIEDNRHKVVFHTLRHTFASWLAIKNTPLSVIKELLGHCTIDLTMRYAHLSQNQLRTAVDSLSQDFTIPC
ncbi:MAG: site-specific integrase [Desulfobulbus sp.]|nr:site-specific integrase [Desulfobulbus sp.]